MALNRSSAFARSRSVAQPQDRWPDWFREPEEESAGSAAGEAPDASRTGAETEET